MTKSIKTWEEIASGLPIGTRETIARARNSKIRVTEYRQRMIEEGDVLRGHVRRLHHHDKLTPNRIADLLEISRSWALELLDLKK